VIVSTKHNCEAVLENPGFGQIHGLLTRFTDVVIAVSSSVAEHIATTGHVEGPKIVVVHYGIEDVGESSPETIDRALAELGIDQSSPLVLCVARLDPQKDHETLLRAWKDVTARVQSARLLLAGGTQLGGEEYVDGLKRLTAALGIGKTVIFAGVRSDVGDLMAACDVLAMSSRWEGVGLVFLEAMRARRPVVATRVGGIPEVVIHGETGYLVDAGDPAALASSLVRLIEDRGSAKTMGEQGRDRYEQRFSAEQMLNKMSGLYAKLLAK
jgi:glycosyltransferase involved in cell wall biosynthesis